MSRSAEGGHDVLDGFHDIVVPGLIAALQRIEILRRGGATVDPDELLGDTALALTLVLEHVKVMHAQLRSRAVIDVSDGATEAAARPTPSR